MLEEYQLQVADSLNGDFIRNLLNGDPNSGDVLLLVPAAARLRKSDSPQPVSAQRASPPPTPSAPPPQRVFRLAGRVREVVFGGTRALFSERKGFHYMQLLLARPRQPVAAVDLKAAADGVDRRVFRGSRGAVMARDAMDELRTRYLALQEELEEARSQRNVLRQEQLERDMEVLVDAVRRATGMAGAERELSDAQRVRVAVTNAIRRSIWKIEQDLPEAAAYFRRTLRTGFLCMYLPDGEEPWEC